MKNQNTAEIQRKSNFKMLSTILFSMLSISTLAGCGKTGATNGNASVSGGAAPSELEVAMTSVGSMADDSSASGNSQAAVQMSSSSLPSGAAPVSSSLCGYVAASATCQKDQPQAGEGLRQATYSGCTIPDTFITVTGQVSLTYSNNTCSLATAGDSVLRTYGMSYTDILGVTWAADINPNNLPDYNGNVYGGGGELDRTSSGWSAIIHGRHEKLTGPKGTVLVDMSLRTLSPLQITGTLSRVNRVVNSGQIEVNHNLAKYTATFSPVNLTWNSAQCCHPVSGQLNVTYSGSKTGAASIVFNGCGTASMTNPDGSTSGLSLSSCE